MRYFDERVVTTVQKVTYGVVFWPFRLLWRLKATVDTSLLTLPRGRYLMVANHRAALDAHLMLSALPYETFIKLTPIRFFAANNYLRWWWQRLLLQATGCFLAYAADGKLSGVKAGLKLASMGNSLFIFPEGKRQSSQEPVDLKPGVGRLVKAREFTVLPVYIEHGKGTTVVWGKPLRVPKNVRVRPADAVTEYVFEKVLELGRT